VAATPKGIQTLADSLLPTDRVAREVTGSWCEIVRLLEPHVSRIIVVPFGDWQIAKFAAACAGCPLADRCTSAKEGRTVYVGSFEQQLARVPQRQSDPACKADYKATLPRV